MGVALRRRGTASRLRLWSFASGFFCAAALALLLAQWGAWGTPRRPGPGRPSSPAARRWYTAGLPRRGDLNTETQQLGGEAVATTRAGRVAGWLGFASGDGSDKVAGSEGTLGGGSLGNHKGSQSSQRESQGRHKGTQLSHRESVDSHRGSSACHRRTSSGLCVADVFRWADESFR